MTVNDAVQDRLDSMEDGEIQDTTPFEDTLSFAVDYFQENFILTVNASLNSIFNHSPSRSFINFFNQKDATKTSGGIDTPLVILFPNRQKLRHGVIL